MYHHLVTDPSKQLLCPLICYTDSIQIDSLSWFSLEPLLFTPALLSHAACKKDNAWQPFGYVQQLQGNRDATLKGAHEAAPYPVVLAKSEIDHALIKAETNMYILSRLVQSGKVCSVQVMVPIIIKHEIFVRTKAKGKPAHSPTSVQLGMVANNSPGLDLL